MSLPPRMQLADSDGNRIDPRPSVFYTESTTPLAGNATLTGTSRDVGVAAGTGHSRSYFYGFVYADQAGTFSIEASNNGSTWYPATSAPVVASTALIISVPVLMRYHRVKLVNGATLQGSLVCSSGYVS